MKLKKNTYMIRALILILGVVLSLSVSGQIEPWQIANDPDGAGRMLLTDENGEYVRVDLTDAIRDSIGIDMIDSTALDDSGVLIIYSGDNVDSLDLSNLYQSYNLTWTPETTGNLHISSTGLDGSLITTEIPLKPRHVSITSSDGFYSFSVPHGEAWEADDTYATYPLDIKQNISTVEINDSTQRIYISYKNQFFYEVNDSADIVFPLVDSDTDTALISSIVHDSLSGYSFEGVTDTALISAIVSDSLSGYESSDTSGTYHISIDDDIDDENELQTITIDSSFTDYFDAKIYTVSLSDGGAVNFYNSFSPFARSFGSKLMWHNVADWKYGFGVYPSGSYKFEIGGGETNISELTINGNYTFPATDGSSGQWLKTNGSGAASWSTIDYSDIDNTPTVPDAIWTLNGSDAYYDDGGGVAINRTSAEGIALNLLGRANIADASYNLFLNGAGNTTTTGSNNIGMSLLCLSSLTTGAQNVALGGESLNGLTTGSNNMALGYRSMKSNQTGSSNVGIGYRSMQTMGVANAGNVGIGYISLYSADNNFNVGVGQSAGFHSQGNSVAIGAYSGYQATTGGVYIGYEAGRYNYSDNKLFIDNSSTANPLIEGDFSTNELTVNGELLVTDLVGGTAVYNVNADATGQLVRGDLVESGATYTAGDGIDITSDVISVTNPHGYGGMSSERIDITTTAATSLDMENLVGTTDNTTTGTNYVDDYTYIDVDDAGVWMVTVSGTIYDYTVSEVLLLRVLVNGLYGGNMTMKAPDDNFGISYSVALELDADDRISLSLDSVSDSDYDYGDIKLILHRIN